MKDLERIGPRVDLRPRFPEEISMEVNSRKKTVASQDLPSVMFSELLPLSGRMERSVSSLEDRRRETYAMRDMWKSAQWSPDEFSRLKSFNPFSPRGREGMRSTQSFGRSTGRLLPLRKQKDDIPIHTAITERPAKDTERKNHFNALNKKLLVRLPNIFDPPIALPAYAKRDIGEWRNEIQKKVPERPRPYVTASARSDIRSGSAVQPLRRETTKDSSCMFQPTSCLSKAKGKEYMIDPEWTSETLAIHSVDKRRQRFVRNWIG